MIRFLFVWFKFALARFLVRIANYLIGYLEVRNNFNKKIVYSSHDALDRSDKPKYIYVYRQDS